MSDEQPEELTNPAFAIRVTVEHGRAAGQTHEVKRFPAVIGRSKDVDVRLDDDPDDPTISRQHVRLGLEGGCITVEDLSTNGTWVGDQKVGPRQTIVVGEDAFVRLGPRTIIHVQVVPDLPQAEIPAPRTSWLGSLFKPQAKPDATGVVELRALGPFSLAVNGIPIPGDLWQHRKSVVLLAHLADVGQPTSADRLWEVLWPDAADGRQTVQTAVSRVRKALRGGAPGVPDLIRFERKLYALDPTFTVWYDVAELEQWTREAKRLWAARDVAGAGKALDCALDLYRGPFLEGHDEAWVERRRTYLQRSWFEALELLGALREEEKRWEEAAGVYQRILDADAGREQAHLGLVRSLAALGRRDDALRQCTHSITSLRKLLNLPPSPEMEALYRSLTGAAPPG